MLINSLHTIEKINRLVDKPTPINRFIIIDDDPLSNMICKLTLELLLEKPAIEVFTTATEGLHYFATLNAQANVEPAILMLDINMPVMSGWEFLSRFDDLPEIVKMNIKVYILSSSVDLRDRDRSYSNINVKNHFTKPLTIGVIREIVIAA